MSKVYTVMIDEYCLHSRSDNILGVASSKEKAKEAIKQCADEFTRKTDYPDLIREEKNGGYRVGFYRPSKDEPTVRCPIAQFYCIEFKLDDIDGMKEEV